VRIIARVRREEHMNSNVHQPRDQYADSTNLSARVRTYAQYSTNPQGWGNWLSQQLDLQDGSIVLDATEAQLDEIDGAIGNEIHRGGPMRIGKDAGVFIASGPRKVPSGAGGDD
jgi:hypothetical protein